MKVIRAMKDFGQMQVTITTRFIKVEIYSLVRFLRIDISFSLRVIEKDNNFVFVNPASFLD